MVIATRADHTFTFTTPDDLRLAPRHRTVWLLRLLTPKQREWWGNSHAQHNAMLWSDDVCRAGIDGWQNLRDVDGGSILFADESTGNLQVCGDSEARKSTVTRALLERLPPAVRISLANAILSGPQFTEDDVGN